MSLKKNDYFLIAVIILFAFVMSLGFRIYRTKGEYAVIMSDGEEFKTIPLYKDATVSVKGKNTVTIKDGEVYVTSADCPDKLCISQGKIKDTNKTIVCLPNKMSVKIKKGK